jgi:hypothetical protein
MSGSSAGAVKRLPQKLHLSRKGSTIMILAEIIRQINRELRKNMRIIGTTLAFRWAA